MGGVRTIGVIGGIASGKSRVSALLAELGAHVLEADKVGHAVLADDPEVRAAILDRWGNGVLAGVGSLDRRAIARRVFGPNESAAGELKFLESLLHPRIHRRLLAQRDEWLAGGQSPIVIEPSMLLESGYTLKFDVLVMVDADGEVRLARARQRGWSDEQFAAREAAQWPVEKKRQQADVVIANNGTEDELRQAVRAFWEKYVGPAPAGTKIN